MKKKGSGVRGQGSGAGAAGDSRTPNPQPPTSTPYVGRGGLKLEHALREFSLDVSGCIAADFGCNVGGFTDCLLRHGAARVYAVDTGYGVLDYRLRNDPRVVVMERTNALHIESPADGVDLVVADVGWTPQRFVIPAGRRWLGNRERGRIVTLIKPHYEAAAMQDGDEPRHAKESRKSDEPRSRKRRGRPARATILDPDEARNVLDRMLAEMPSLGVEVLAWTESPIRGGKSKGHTGNVEYLALLKPMENG